MAITVYKWSDASAPQLTGTAGSLITLLDAVLVNGYGTQPAAGWTKPFSSTNAADYRMGGGNQFYIEVNDNAPGGGGGREARIRGYEAMTAFNTGTGLFPTTAQATNGLFVRKSTSADTVTRPWIIVGDNTTFYMFTLSGDQTLLWFGWMFGGFASFKPSDGYKTIIIARTTENGGGIAAENLDLLHRIDQNLPSHYMARTTTGTGTAIQFGKIGDLQRYPYGGSTSYFNGNLQFTNQVNNKLFASPVRVTHTDGGNTVRGILRGMYHFCHAANILGDQAILTGSGDLSGKTFLALRSGGQIAGTYIIETSNTWVS